MDRRGNEPPLLDIGRYRVIERIGRGAVGVVYRAHDEAMRRDVALKVLVADDEDDPEIRVRFQREAEAAAHLAHPNIVTIYDVGEDRGRFFIVMELLRGETLKALLRRPMALSIQQRIDLMIQLCTGLSAAHNASICHRDVKPGNIFVREDGILKILDFGVARLASSGLTGSGFIVGTPDYMSPEQARGAEIDARSDIFSAGGVFYFMLTGRKPFPAVDLPTLFHQIQDDPPASIAGEHPPELVDVVMRALSKQREERYQSCLEMRSDLERVRAQYAWELPLPSGAPAAVLPPGPVAQEATAEPETRSDDTVELPTNAPDPDDTVGFAPPRATWRDMVATIGSAVTGARARLRRPSPRRPSDTHARER